MAEQSLISVKDAKFTDCFIDDAEIILDSTVKINTACMPSKLITALKRTATFANPEFFKLQKMRFSTWNIPKYIFCGELYHELTNTYLSLPRGNIDTVKEIRTGNYR